MKWMNKTWKCHKWSICNILHLCCTINGYMRPFFWSTKKRENDIKKRKPGIGGSAGRPARSGRPQGRKWALQIPHFPQVFIRFADMSTRHVRFIYKPNAFLIILEAILRFGPQNDQYSTGFIRYFDQLFSMLQNDLGPMLFQHFAKS